MKFSIFLVKLQFLLSVAVFSLLGQSAQASTVLSPSDAIKLESLSVKCSEPGKECPRLPIEDVIEVKYFNVDEEYSLTEDTAEIAKEAGLLVSYKNISEEPQDAVAQSQIVKRFFPMSKVNLSPDFEFYMCGKGQEFTVDNNVDLSSVGLSEGLLHSIFDGGYQPMTFVCKCFWAPQRMFDELGIKKFDKKLPDMKMSDILFDELLPSYLTDSATQSTPLTTVYGDTPVYHSPFNPPYIPGGNPPPVTPHVPIASVGSECGLFQFICAYNVLMHPKESAAKRSN